MDWKQHFRLHSTSSRTAWDRDIPYSQMYPPNITVNWCDTDTPENAQYEKDIKYTFNEFGFRSDSFHERSDLNVLVVGCSMTVGVGVDQHENWPNQLKQMLIETTGKSVTMWNLATSGASGDYCSRMIFKVAQRELVPTAIAIHWPPITRLELPTTHPGKITQGSIHIPEIFPQQLVDEDYLMYNHNKNLALVRAIAKNKQAPLLSNPLAYSPVQQQMMDENPFIADTTARDGMHPGPEWHKRVAAWYLKEWQEAKLYPLSTALQKLDK